MDRDLLLLWLEVVIVAHHTYGAEGGEILSDDIVDIGGYDFCGEEIARGIHMAAEVEILFEFVIVNRGVLVEIDNVGIIEHLSDAVERVTHSRSDFGIASGSRHGNEEEACVRLNFLIALDYVGVIADEGLAVFSTVLKADVLKASELPLAVEEVVNAKGDDISVGGKISLPEAVVICKALYVLLSSIPPREKLYTVQPAIRARYCPQE